MHGHLPGRLHQLHREWGRDGAASAPAGAGAQPRSGPLRLGLSQDRPRHGQGRRPLPSLRIVRRALPDRRLGHAAIPARHAARPWEGLMPTMKLSEVNDFVVKFANVNGSGSASANRLFARSILRMGVPVATRNIFPSNIQGLPTWYEVRVSEAGHIGRRGGCDLMVAMNPQTWTQDVKEVDAGGYLFYDSTRPMPPSRFRSDIKVLGMPLTAICNE